MPPVFVGPRSGRECFSRTAVDSERLLVEKLIRHEVHGSGIGHGIGLESTYRRAAGASFSWAKVSDQQPFFTVEPLGAPVLSVQALRLQQGMQAPTALADPALSQFFQAHPRRDWYPWEARPRPMSRHVLRSESAKTS